MSERQAPYTPLGPVDEDYVRRVRVLRVIDGDTLVADVDLGYHVQASGVAFRLARCNAPEMSTQAGQNAAVFTITWVNQHEDHGGALPIGAFAFVARSVKTDDWRRWIAEVQCRLGHDLSDALLENGQAVPYP